MCLSDQLQKRKGNVMTITEKALYQRINRRLKHDGEVLRTARSQRTELTVGRYYILDVQSNAIAYQHVDLEELGRKLGVLLPGEQLAETA